MKQCPRCPREYSDNLNFCLEDGARLISKTDDDKTWILPPPVPTITVDPPIPPGPPDQPGPTVPSPAPQRSRTRKVLGAMGAILAVGLIALIKIAPWSDRWNQPGAQNTNEAPVVSSFAPTVAPSTATTTPDNTQTTPTPTTPSPEPEVSLIRMYPVAPSEQLTPGIYVAKFQPKNKPEDALGLRTVRLVFTFNADGTYLAQGYLTLHGTDVNDRLYREERGHYTATTDRINFRERIAREFDSGNDVWKPWAVPDTGASGADTIRNLTPTSFELYSDGDWVFVNKVY